MDKLKPYITPGIVAIITGVVLTAWNTFRPATIAEHQADIAELDGHQAHIEDKLDRNYNAWRCDEWAEEIDAILADVPITPLEAEQVRRLQGKFNNNDCMRFVDE